jgi:SMC interacting uncharacterized protein involved in chromosome segregation
MTEKVETAKELETGEVDQPVFQFTDEDEGVVKTYPLNALNMSAKTSIVQIQRLEERLMSLQIEAEDVQVALAHRRSTLKQRLPSDNDAEIIQLERKH